MNIFAVLLLCGHLLPMRCAPFTDDAVLNHTHVRDQRLFSSNSFDSGDIDVSGQVHGHDVSIGSSVDIEVGQSGSMSPPPTPVVSEPTKTPTGLLPPAYTEVPGFELCLGKESLGSSTNWCFPAHKPEACKHEAWSKLSHYTGELDPCSKEKSSGLLPPAYTEVPGYKLCLGKESLGSSTNWCFPAHKPEACKHEAWSKLSHHMGELDPCSREKPSGEVKCPELKSVPKGPQGPAGGSLAYDLLSNTHKDLKYGEGQLGAFVPRTIYHPDNDEQEIYVPSAVSQDPATNVITITAKKYQDSRAIKITSGRMDTKGVWSTAHSDKLRHRGYLEVRALMPAKTDGGSYRGAWPAIRLLGVDDTEWPKNGEIDVAELRNGEPSVLMTLHSTNHHGAYGQNPPHNPLHLDTDMTKIPVTFGLEWHVKADDGQIDLTWWITSFDIPSQQWKNEKTTKSLLQSEGDAEDYAVFMKSFNEGGFYLLINLAQGGDFTGVYDKDALLRDGSQHVVIESAKVYEFPVVEQKLPGSGEAVVMNNIGYIFKGYDIMKGNPLPVDGLSQDPGYRQPIFEATYTLQPTAKTADERYLQPDGTNITDCSGTCSLSFQTVEISGSKSYQDTLSNKASLYSTYEGYGAKFSASASYKNVHDATSSGSNLYTQSSASCCSYTVYNFDGYEYPPFTADFLTAVKSLTDEYDEDVYQRFIENFGTHFILRAQMGALYGLQSEVSKEAWTNMLEKDLTISTAASAQAYGFAMGGKFSNSNNKKMSEEFKSSVTYQKIFTIGVKPPTDEKIESWVQETFDAPAPMKLLLGSMVDLLDSFHWGMNAPIDVSVTHAVRENLERALDDYCPLLKKRGEVSTCEAPGSDPPKPVLPMKRTWMGWSNKNFNGHSNPVKQCPDGHYVDRMTWMSQNNYGIIDLEFSCSDGTIYRMAGNSRGKDDRQMNCEGSKGGFRQMTGRRKYNWGIINVRSFCLNQETQQTANDDLRGWWEQTRMCKKNQKIVGIQTQEQGGYGIVNFQFQCAIVPSDTDSGCAKQDNIDYYGNDIPDKNKVLVSGVEECINWCGETAACKYWTFNKLSRHCYLKTSNIGVTENADGISGTKNCATGCVKEGNTDYYGNDIPDKNKVVSGLEECINWCGETAACKYWTFNKLSRHCYLKTSNIGVTENADGISGSKNCATGCSIGEEYEGNCYLLVETAKTWMDAQDECWAMSGTLASVHNAEANNYLANLAGGARAWIGATDAETEGSWKWTNGDDFLFTNWSSGNPDNYKGKQHCGVINYQETGKWDDETCDEPLLPFICQGIQLFNTSGKGQLLYWRQWSEIQAKIWSDDECKNLRNYASSGLEDCKDACLETARCTAINYNQVSKECVMRGCTRPVPAPQWQYGDYRGYYILDQFE